MYQTVVRGILVLALPTLVFLGGVWVMSKISGRDYVTGRLRETAAEADRKPLNQRFGYDSEAVDRHWSALDDRARESERLFLQLDLIFPILYGAALLAGLWMAWSALGRPFHIAWIATPVLATVAADWCENAIQLTQLRRFAESGAAGLQPAWIQIASAATIVKLAAFAICCLLLLALAVASTACPARST